MLKNFYLSLTHEHQDLIFNALINLGFLAAALFILIVFIIILGLIWEWFL